MPRNWKENTFTCKPRVKASRTGRQHKYKRTPRSLRKLILCDNCRELYNCGNIKRHEIKCNATFASSDPAKNTPIIQKQYKF
jgi:hypothetical protein